jgi:hypothetical protein
MDTAVAAAVTDTAVCLMFDCPPVKAIVLFCFEFHN